MPIAPTKFDFMRSGVCFDEAKQIIFGRRFREHLLDAQFLGPRNDGRRRRTRNEQDGNDASLGAEVGREFQPRRSGACADRGSGRPAVVHDFRETPSPRHRNQPHSQPVRAGISSASRTAGSSSTIATAPWSLVAMNFAPTSMLPAEAWWIMWPFFWRHIDPPQSPGLGRLWHGTQASRGRLRGRQRAGGRALATRRSDLFARTGLAYSHGLITGPKMSLLAKHCPRRAHGPKPPTTPSLAHPRRTRPPWRRSPRGQGCP